MRITRQACWYSCTKMAKHSLYSLWFLQKCFFPIENNPPAKGINEGHGGKKEKGRGENGSEGNKGIDQPLHWVKLRCCWVSVQKNMLNSTTGHFRCQRRHSGATGGREKEDASEFVSWSSFKILTPTCWFDSKSKPVASNIFYSEETSFNSSLSWLSDILCYVLKKEVQAFSRRLPSHVKWTDIGMSFSRRYIESPFSSHDVSGCSVSDSLPCTMSTGKGPALRIHQLRPGRIWNERFRFNILISNLLPSH